MATSSSPTNLSTVPSWSNTTLDAVRVKPVEEAVELADDIPSAKVVEPRMSAKSIVHSISAPPWCLVTNVKHELHMVGFESDGRLPDQPHDRCGDTRERGCAHPTARLVREVQEDASCTTLDVVAPGQKVSPECLVGIGWLGRGHASVLLVADRFAHSARKRKPPVLPKGPGQLQRTVSRRARSSACRSTGRPSCRSRRPGRRRSGSGSR